MYVEMKVIGLRDVQVMANLRSFNGSISSIKNAPVFCADESHDFPDVVLLRGLVFACVS